MLQVKMPYYPKVEAYSMETTFGAVEVSCPKLYETPLDGMTILRVDLLECLRDIVGDNCLMYRDLFYKLVAGSTETQAEHIELFESFYRRFEKFTAYVNNLYYYGESTIPLIPRVLNELRDVINANADASAQLLNNSGGKYLVHTHDYLYYGFKKVVAVPEVKGSLKIC